MDRPFIKLMCESYYNDLNLSKVDLFKDRNKIINEFYDELSTLMENVKIEDEDLYYEIFKELDRGSHKNLSYFLITDYLTHKYNMFETVDIDLSSFNTPEQYLLEYYNPTMAPDVIGNVLGVGSSLPSAGANPGAVGAAMDAAMSNAASSLVSIPAVLGGIATMLAVIGFWKNISRAGWKALTALNDMNKKVSDIIHNLTRSGKVKQALFVTNADICWKKCNYKPEELSRFVGFVLSGRYVVTTKAEKQVDCLAACYLNWTLQQVGALCQGYVKCLEATGERDVKLNDLNVFLHQPAGAECKKYYDILKQHHDDFFDSIAVIFQSNPTNCEYWKRKYYQMLHDHLSNVSAPRTGNLQKSYLSGQKETSNQHNTPQNKPNFNPRR